MKLRDYLNESSYGVGDWIKQTGSDYVTYGKITQKLKNGSFKAVTFQSIDGKVTGKAKIQSLSGWYPNPVKIKETEIPEKVIAKINQRL